MCAGDKQEGCAEPDRAGGQVPGGGDSGAGTQGYWLHINAKGRGRWIDLTMNSLKYVIIYQLHLLSFYHILALFRPFF